MLPNVPTFAELGLSGVLSDTWTGLMGPANLPREIVTRYDEIVRKSFASVEIRDKIVALGAQPLGQGPAEFQKIIVSEIDKFEQLARQPACCRRDSAAH